VLLRSELHDCLARVQGVLVRAEDALGKLQTVPLLPKLVVRSFGRVDVCVLPMSRSRPWLLMMRWPWS
jgi:hypothetical protein